MDTRDDEVLDATASAMRPGAGGARQRSAPISKATWAAEEAAKAEGDGPQADLFGDRARVTPIASLDPDGLRKLIEEDNAKPRYIQTVWGFGYVFVPDGGAQ